MANLGIEINVAKTKAIKFRRAGRLAVSDELRLSSVPIEYVPCFTYLGLTLTPSGRAFSEHINNRIRKTMVACAAIHKPSLLSLQTALALFNLKLAPMASYCIPLIWDKLSIEELGRLDRVKPAFLKRVLGLHTTCQNRLVYLLADTPLFIEDLQRQFALPRTAAFDTFLQQWETKMAEVRPEFFTTGAMRDSAWKGVNRTNRHIVTRFAVHGFHHLLCSTRGFHLPDDTCVCRKCNSQCDIYHGQVCPEIESITTLSRVPLS